LRITTSCCANWRSDRADFHDVRAGAPGARALLAPLNDYFYGQADLFGIAAAYAFHIAQAQAFIDGNKRTAIVVALEFLELNGIAAETNTAPLYDAMIGIAERRLTKSDLAQLFRELFG
jgi:death-on-curing protein